jgi:dsDNA-binding SOS-regulon protein
MAEKYCLMFILELITKYGPKMLIRAKFIEKWLVKQNWGEEEEERRQNFRMYMEHKDNRIVDIVKNIRFEKEGCKVLQKSKLINKEDFGREEGSDSNRISVILEISMPTDDENGEPQITTHRSSTRAREHSAEEQRLRRQHREAMVLNDGTRPIGREDIIERERDSPS